MQSYGSHALNASTLLMVLTGFAGPMDLLMLSTIERVQKELSSGSLKHRYSPQKAARDDLGRVEGTFKVCSFWLVEALARAGRVDEARFLIEQMLSYSNEVGLYPEKFGPTGQALGNFPQALTHVALISTWQTADQALNVKRRTPAERSVRMPLLRMEDAQRRKEVLMPPLWLQILAIVSLLSALAYLLGIIFHYFAIAAMRGLSFGPSLWAAVKADTLSLTAFDVGIFGWMALPSLVFFHSDLHPNSPVYWFIMQIGMIIGSGTSYPMN